MASGVLDAVFPVFAVVIVVLLGRIVGAEDHGEQETQHVHGASYLCKRTSSVSPTPDANQGAHA